MLTLTRRAAMSLLPLALLPAPLWAETCPELLPGLRLCDAGGWTPGPVKNGVLTLTHVTGITGAIQLVTGLDTEEEDWARWQQSHAPMSARANILDDGYSEIDGRVVHWSAWRPRHVDVPTIVAMTGYVGEGFSLRVTTHAEAETYDTPHREAQESLRAAIKLDIPR
jgi:hypothetical protein